MLAISLEQSVPLTDLVNNGKAPRSLELFKRRKQGFLSPLVVHSAHRLKQIFKRLVDVSAAEFAIVDLPKMGQYIVWMGRIRCSLPSIPGWSM
jgi:hypothetical protein